MGVLWRLLKKKKQEQKQELKPLFEEPKKFVVTDDTPISNPSEQAKKFGSQSEHDLEEKLSELIQKKQKQKTLYSIIPKKEATEIGKLKESLKKEIEQANAVQVKQKAEEAQSAVQKVEGLSKHDLEVKRSLKVIEYFLTQLVDELGANNEFEILKVFGVNDGWKALVKVNGDLYSFDLAINGEIISFEELEAELGE
ncbi:MAG: hypothetical protein Q7S21_00640 [archaeon]|nr:hypothetical protein [archaeon]